MKKASIKVIKRKDAEEMANAKTQRAGEPKQSVPASEEKKERDTRREITVTISNWITECRENNRIEKDVANGEMFDKKPLLKDI
jgi:hypothetical protein